MVLKFRVVCVLSLFPCLWNNQYKTVNTRTTVVSACYKVQASNFRVACSIGKKNSENNAIQLDNADLIRDLFLVVHSTHKQTRRYIRFTFILYKKSSIISKEKRIGKWHAVKKNQCNNDLMKILFPSFPEQVYNPTKWNFKLQRIQKVLNEDIGYYVYSITI